MKCEICGREDKLVEAIGEKEIISVCRRCAEQNNLPVVNRPSSDQMRNISRFVGVHERLAEQAGIDLKKHRNKEFDEELKKVVSQNVKFVVPENIVDNFHWHIQNARRSKKISQKQLAEEIAEPEILIELAEKGKLPENYEKFVGKLEQFFGIRLMQAPKKKENVLDLDKIDAEQVTIGELREMHEEKVGPEEKAKKQSILDEVAKRMESRRERRKWWQKDEEFG